MPMEDVHFVCSHTVNGSLDIDHRYEMPAAVEEEPSVLVNWAVSDLSAGY